MKTLDPKQYFDAKGICGINKAHLQLMNGLASKRVARTPAEMEEAKSKIQEAQSNLAKLYTPYLTACRSEGCQAMKLADVAEELRIFSNEED